MRIRDFLFGDRAHGGGFPHTVSLAVLQYTKLCKNLIPAAGRCGGFPVSWKRPFRGRSRDASDRPAAPGRVMERAAVLAASTHFATFFLGLVMGWASIEVVPGEGVASVELFLEGLWRTDQ